MDNDSNAKPSGRSVGYARVSTGEQNLNMQLDALKRSGVMPELIFSDAATGGNMKRPGLERALKVLSENDVLVVWKLDRLGRTVKGVLEAIEALEERGIGIKSLTEDFNTKTPMGRAVLTILITLAEMERGLISERTREGLKAYQDRGGKMGPKHRIRDYPKRLARFQELFASGQLKDMSGREIVDDMNAIDPKAPPIKVPQVYFNWKSQGFPGAGLDELEPPLDAAE